MIVGIGCDVVEISRIESAYRRLGMRFLERIFSETERVYCLKRKNPFPSFAARFAAKEAAAKALGCGVGANFSWLDCSVATDDQGKPYLIWSERSQKFFGPFVSHLSLSHTNTSACAMVVLEQP